MPTKTNIEDAAQQFLSMGVGLNGKGAVVIRSGALGAFITTTDRGGRWVEAYWQKDNISKVVDVTGKSHLLKRDARISQIHAQARGTVSWADSLQDWPWGKTCTKVGHVLTCAVWSTLNR